MPCLSREQLVIELSDDGKRVRCNTCEAVRGHNSGWIQKESLAYHLKSSAHARSVSAQHNRELLRAAGEQSMQAESVMEQSMDFVMLSSTVQPAVTVRAPVHVASMEEQNMWDNQLSNEAFDAGVDHAAAADDERKRLEQEAADFEIWHGADFLPEEDPNSGELLLEELEQDDILAELLRNARKSSVCLQFSIF